MVQLKKFKIEILLLFLFLHSLNIYGQEWITFRDTNSGLPNNYVENIVIDTANVKWMIDRDENLVRFDGVTWTVYNQFNSPLPFGLNHITVDKFNNKWISTNGGLVKYDGNNWTIFDTSNSCIPENIITKCVVDTSGKIAWFLTYHGVVKLDLDSMTCSLIDTIGGNDITIDTKNWVWITGGGTSSLFIFDQLHWIEYHSGIPLIYPVQIVPFKLFADSLGNVWAAAQAWPGGYIYGILKYDTAFSVPFDTSLSINFGGTSVVYSQTNLLACYGTFSSSLNYFDGISWSYYDQTNSPLNYWDILDMRADKLGNLWIVTENGVHIFNKNQILNIDSRMNNLKFKAFPSPASDFVFLNSSAGINFNEAILTDIRGANIKRLHLELVQGNSTKEVRFKSFIGDIENGLYFLIYKDGITQYSQLISIIH